jgi:hypothetical protein
MRNGARSQESAREGRGEVGGEDVVIVRTNGGRNETPLHRTFQDQAQVEDHATSYRCMEGWMSHEGGEGKRAICFGGGVVVVVVVEWRSGRAIAR